MSQEITLDCDCLQVLLISDETTDKSAAALDVHIGHMSDPGELPGLAHFCEHMLFLGTDRFPDENEYSKFLSQHGGSFNAFTSSDHTNYYFDVSPEHLGYLALNVFSSILMVLMRPVLLQMEPWTGLVSFFCPHCLPNLLQTEK